MHALINQAIGVSNLGPWSRSIYFYLVDKTSLVNDLINRL